jgi:hypothetical protein
MQTREMKGMMGLRIADDYAAGSGSPAAPTAKEKYCPECGRLFSEQVLGLIRQPARHSWSTWVLCALGVYLLVLFGPRAVVSVSAMANDQNPSFQRRALSAAESPSVLAAMVRTESAQTPLDLFTVNRSPSESAREATGLGGALILLGLSASARQQLSRPVRQTIGKESEAAPPAAVSHIARTVFGLWEFGEAFALAAFRVLVVFACYFGVMPHSRASRYPGG